MDIIWRTYILALNYTLWVKIGQKWDSQIWAYILQKGLLIQNWLFRLGRVAVDPYLVQKENEGSDKSCLITYDVYEVLKHTKVLLTVNRPLQMAKLFS